MSIVKLRYGALRENGASIDTSGGVSSVQSATGIYDITFATAMSSTAYTIQLTERFNAGVHNHSILIPSGKTVSGFRVNAYEYDAGTNVLFDTEFEYLVVQINPIINTPGISRATWGAQSGDGSTIAGSGDYTCVREAEGKYRITFTTAYADAAYGVMVTANREGQRRYIMHSAALAGSFLVSTENYLGADADSEFEFLCIEAS